MATVSMWSMTNTIYFIFLFVFILKFTKLVKNVVNTCADIHKTSISLYVAKYLVKNEAAL